MHEEKNSLSDDFSDLAHVLRRLSKRISRCLECMGSSSATPVDIIAAVHQVAEEALEVFESASDYIDSQDVTASSL